MCFPGDSVVKNLLANQETQETCIQCLVKKILWRRKCQPTSVFLPGKSHEEKSLVGYRTCCHKEADTGQQLNNSI